ncbi:MAG: fibrillarin-like rRNA/tRNA 2'-O-methyltransferase [Candidatus Bathyarchaeota archaeon]|nr:MAG: fibrillarin-like rRNA/tRNA 2'-O-methyltransferase [Candidatus Bathyarchaeota archaeon]
MVIDVKNHSRFPGVYWATYADGSQKLATRNLVPGKTVYDESLINHRRVEYRLWNPFRSKLAAVILNGLELMPIQPRCEVLYLGAASGTTASHVSDIVGAEGYVYCVEFAARAIRDLVANVCEFRPNMAPVLMDARLPDRYSALVGKVDAIYCDIAQPEQAKVLGDNADLFLKGAGRVLLAIKAQSIDVTKEPTLVYQQEMEILMRRNFRIDAVIPLEPYDKAHAMIVAERLGR